MQQQLNKLESKIYPTEFMFTDGKELKINHNEVPDWILATESSNKVWHSVSMMNLLIHYFVSKFTCVFL